MQFTNDKLPVLPWNDYIFAANWRADCEPSSTINIHHGKCRAWLFPENITRLDRNDRCHIGANRFVLIQASGVQVSDECKAVYDKIKAKKDFRYVVFRINGEKTIDVEVTGD